MVLVTHIDAEGRVMDYKILSGQHSPELTYRLDRLMYFSQFHPATMFGRPTGGQVVLSLRRITVRGRAWKLEIRNSKLDPTARPS